MLFYLALIMIPMGIGKGAGLCPKGRDREGSVFGDSRLRANFRLGLRWEVIIRCYVSSRATGMAITLAASRFGAIMGNVLFGYLVESNCAIPLVSVSALLISGGLLGILLPNTTRQSLMWSLYREIFINITVAFIQRNFAPNFESLLCQHFIHVKETVVIYKSIYNYIHINQIDL